MDVLFAVQSHLKPPSKPEASSHRYPDPEARVPAERLLSTITRDSPDGLIALVSTATAKLFNQYRRPLPDHAVEPARQQRTIEHQPMLEELIALPQQSLTNAGSG